MIHKNPRIHRGVPHRLKSVMFVLLQVRPTLLPEAPKVFKNPLKTAARYKSVLLTNVVQARCKETVIASDRFGEKNLAGLNLLMLISTARVELQEGFFRLEAHFYVSVLMFFLSQ